MNHLFVSFLLAVTLAGCGDKDDDTGDQTGACALAAEHGACPECYSGEVTCTYAGVSETAGSCGDCQARTALYGTLCADENSDEADDIESGTVCSDPVQDRGR
jgi:hypothetical protein